MGRLLAVVLEAAGRDARDQRLLLGIGWRPLYERLDALIQEVVGIDRGSGVHGWERLDALILRLRAMVQARG